MADRVYEEETRLARDRPSMRERLGKLEALVSELSEQMNQAARHIGDLQDEVGMRDA